MSKVFYKNKIVDEKETAITYRSRAFRYADGLFETIRLINGKPVFLKNHIDRIKKGLELMKISTPDLLLDEEKLNSTIKNLALKNGIEKGGVCRMIVWRDAEGRYMPENDNCDFLLEISPYPNNLFLLSKSGKSIEIYQEMRKQNNFLSPYKTLNAQLNVMAAISARNKGLDDNLISNEEGMIIESTNSNVFIVSNGTIYTPPLSDGCVGGTMRMNIINAALELKLSVYESSLNQQHFLMANEILLSNAIVGIDWVNAFKHKRYYSTIASKLVDQLNKDAMNL
jgi:branched-chain amino acid aminotransferase